MLISTNITDMALDLMKKDFFHIQLVGNATVFGADTSSSTHIDNKKADISILGKDPTQVFGKHSLTTEKMYSINFSTTKRGFCLSLHYNGVNSYLFVNGIEIIKLKAKDSEIIPDVLCSGNISKDFSAFSAGNMNKKTGLYGTVYDFSVNYGAISVGYILNIYKYFKKNKHTIIF